MCDVDAKRSPNHANGYVKVDLKMAERSARPADECAAPHDMRQNGAHDAADHEVDRHRAHNISAQKARTCDECRQNGGGATAGDAVFTILAEAQELPPKQPADEDAEDVRSEISDFDPYEYGNVDNPTSYWGTIMHMFIVGMSPTLLSLPSTFDQVGYVFGSLGSFATVMLYAYCMHMVVDGEYVLCKRARRPKMSYTQVVYHAFATGPRPLRWMAVYAQNLIYAALILIWAGGNAIYVLLISDNIKSTLYYFCQYEVGNRAVIVWLVVPLVLLCWIPNLKLMVFYSICSNTVNVCSILIISCVAAQNLPAIGERKSVGDYTKIPYFLGVIFVTINGTGLLMSLKNQMANPRKFRSKAGVLNVSYVTTGILYALFGLLCYTKYGPNTNTNVILNLPDNVFTNVVKLLYAFGVIFFYPLVSYVTYDMVWNDALRQKFATSAHERMLDYAAKTISASSSILLAYLFPNVVIFVSVTGTVCASLDSIIMPAVINALVYSHQRRFIPLVKDGLIILMGISFLVAGIKDSIRELGHHYSREG